MKLTIIGAGSPYTPELIGKLAEEQNDMPVQEICLMDIDERKLNIMHGYCCRFGKKLGLRSTITQTIDRRRALDGADFVNPQIRVGGNHARVNDEKIPLVRNLIGQETTGPGGFAKGLRTIPVMLDIARDMEQLCPDAWMINYTNPTGLVTEAVIKYSKAKIAGLCSGGFNARWVTAKALDVQPEKVRYDLFGLNHLSFAYNITVDGKPLTKDQFKKVAEDAGEPGREIITLLGAVPIGYLQYYYHTAAKVKALSEAPKSRGEQVLAMEDELFAAFADLGCDTRPAVLDKRGGGGYAEVAVSSIKAIHQNKDTWLPANVPNNGTVRFLPDDAVIETMCAVNVSGFHPLVTSPPPRSVWGLVSAVKNYEQLTVEAAVTGSRDTALLALMAHPLVRDYDIAEALLPELLEANKDYLLQFFPEGTGV
jgi:6-phospho-beta-glucosidase